MLLAVETWTVWKELLGLHGIIPHLMMLLTISTLVELARGNVTMTLSIKSRVSIVLYEGNNNEYPSLRGWLLTCARRVLVGSFFSMSHFLC